MVAGPGVFICQECVHICNQVLATDESQPPMAPTSRSDRVPSRLIRRAATADPWKQLARRLRSWRLAVTD
jgi:ATP-dependent protease Clp ATPase subunit